MVLVHQHEGISDCLVLVDRDRVHDHAVLGALHLADLSGLLGYGHVFMDDADSALSGEGYCHGRFGDCVHCCGHDGDVEGDVAGKPALEADFSGKHFGVCRDEQHIIEGEAVQSNSFIDK